MGFDVTDIAWKNTSDSYVRAMETLKNFFDALTAAHLHSAELDRMIPASGTESSFREYVEAVKKIKEHIDTMPNGPDKTAAEKLYEQYIGNSLAQFGKIQDLEDMAKVLSEMTQMEPQEKEVLLGLISDAMEKDSGVIFTEMSDEVYKKLSLIAEEEGILYNAFDVIGEPRKIILYSKDDMEKIAQYTMEAQIQINDFQILNKRELNDMVFQIEGPNAQLTQFSGLDKFTAEKVAETAARTKGLIAVKEMQKDGTYAILCKQKDADKTAKLIFDAAWSVSGPSGNIEQKRLTHQMNEKNKIDLALQKQDCGYIFSASNPENFIEIKDDYFKYHKAGGPAKIYDYYRYEYNYADILGLRANNLGKNLTYMTEDEVKALGGPTSPELREELKKHIFGVKVDPSVSAYIHAEQNYEKWLSEKLEITADANLAALCNYIDEYPIEKYLAEANKEAIKSRDQDKADRIVRETRTFENGRDTLDNHKKVVEDILSKIQKDNIRLEIPLTEMREDRYGKRAEKRKSLLQSIEREYGEKTEEKIEHTHSEKEMSHNENYRTGFSDLNY